MKSLFSIWYVAPVCLLLSLGACKESSPTLRELIVGDWEAKSFTVDGVELIRNGAKFEMEYDAYSGDNGDFDWKLIEAGKASNYSGDYTVDVADQELILEFSSGNKTTFDLEIVGDKLEISGNLNGQRWQIEADRD